MSDGQREGFNTGSCSASLYGVNCIDIFRSPHRRRACGHDLRKLVVDLELFARPEPRSEHDVYPPTFSDTWGRLGSGLFDRKH